MAIRRWLMAVGLLVAIASGTAVAVAQTADLPELTRPVNDFAHVIDSASSAEMDSVIRALQAKTGDVVVVATVPSIEPYGDIKEYANKLFENRGKGVGQKGKNNGLLIVLAMKEHRVWVEVGYDLEQWITDGFAGETSRQVMTPQFRSGNYGAGLAAGTERIIGRIAQGRGVTLEGVRVPRERRQRQSTPLPVSIPFLIFIAILIISRLAGGAGARRRFWGGGLGGWSSGVGPFGGGGFGGGGGGFGGGFGGFGGGGSGGGGGGSSW